LKRTLSAPGKYWILGERAGDKKIKDPKRDVAKEPEKVG